MLLRQCLACALLSAGMLIAAPASAQQNNNNNQNQSPVAQAAKAVADARLTLKKAQADVQKARDKVKVQLLAKPEWAPVTQELTKAETDLAAAKKAAMTAAHNNPEYQAMVKQRDDADKVRLAANAAPSAGSDDTKVSEADLATASNNYMTAVLKMKAIEKQVIGDDPKIADAGARLDAAKAKMAQLDAEIDEALKNDQDYQNLQMAVATAQQAVDQAEEQLKQTRQQIAEQRASESRSRASSSSSSGSSGGGSGYRR